MKDISMMTPAEIAFKYDGDKRKIAAAVQNGVIPPTLGALAGIFIDRVQKSGARMPERTVAQDIFEGEQQPSGGVAALPVDESMYNMAGGGIVAFAGRGDSFVQTRPGFYELESEVDDDISDLDRARRNVDLFKELYGGVERGPAYEARKKFLEGAGERGLRAAQRQRAITGLELAGVIGSTRGSLFDALAAGARKAPAGLMKAEEMERQAEEAGIKGLAELEDKERAEKLEAIKGGLGLYGKEQERRISSLRGTDFMRRYNLMLPSIMQELGIDDPDDPRVKAATVRAVDFSLGMAGQRVGVQQEGVDVRSIEARTNIERLVTESNTRIDKAYNIQILTAETEAEKKRLTAERDAEKRRREAEIRGGRVAPAAPAAPAAAPSGGQVDTSNPLLRR